jgi:hypothetical protein
MWVIKCALMWGDEVIEACTHPACPRWSAREPIDAPDPRLVRSPARPNAVCASEDLRKCILAFLKSYISLIPGLANTLAVTKLESRWRLSQGISSSWDGVRKTLRVESFICSYSFLMDSGMFSSSWKTRTTCGLYGLRSAGDASGVCSSPSKMGEIYVGSLMNMHCFSNLSGFLSGPSGG